MRGTQADYLTWDYFLETIQKKYVRMRYIEAKRLEFIELRKGNRSVAKYDAELLRLNRYTPGMVVDKQDKCG